MWVTEGGGRGAPSWGCIAVGACVFVIMRACVPVIMRACVRVYVPNSLDLRHPHTAFTLAFSTCFSKTNVLFIINKERRVVGRENWAGSDGLLLFLL